MKKKILIPFLALCFTSFNSLGQTYEHVYADAPASIQAKMDMNKRSGQDILSGVLASHQVGVSGLAANQKDALVAAFSANDKVINVVLSTDFKSINIQSNAWFTKESIQSILSPMSISMIGYAVTYSLTEEN